MEEIEQQPKKIFLNVGIIEAKDLFNKSSKDLIDPYCFVYLTKTNNEKLNTKSKHRKTLSCDFVEKDKCKMMENPTSLQIEKNSSPKFCRSEFYGLKLFNI